MKRALDNRTKQMDGDQHFLIFLDQLAGVKNILVNLIF